MKPRDRHPVWMEHSPGGPGGEGEGRGAPRTLSAVRVRGPDADALMDQSAQTMATQVQQQPSRIAQCSHGGESVCLQPQCSRSAQKRFVSVSTSPSLSLYLPLSLCVCLCVHMCVSVFVLSMHVVYVSVSVYACVCPCSTPQEVRLEPPASPPRRSPPANHVTPVGVTAAP